MMLLTIVLRAGLAMALPVTAQQPVARRPIEPDRRQFEALCARCHGADGAGGEKGPDILHSPTARARSEPDLRGLIRAGIPAAGMPGFRLAEPQVARLAAYVRLLLAPAGEHPTAGDVAAGERFFVGPGDCTKCHMVGGRGELAGPDLTYLAGRLTRAGGTQEFSGGIEGTGRIEWLMCYRADRTAEFVGMQEIEATIDSLRGEFVLTSIGTHDGTRSTGTWRIVPGSGKGELAGIAGNGTWAAGPRPQATFELSYEIAAEVAAASS